MAFVQQRQIPAGKAPVPAVLPKVLTALRFTALDKGAKFSDIARDGLAAAFWRGHGKQQGIIPAQGFSAKTPFSSREWAAVFAVLSKPPTMQCAMLSRKTPSQSQFRFCFSELAIGQKLPRRSTRN